MSARTPEQCDLLLMEAAHAGDIEAAVALYEPNAIFVQDSGEVVTGHPGIRELVKAVFAMKPYFTMKVDAVQSGDGTLALTGSTWSMTGMDPEGKQITMGGRSAEVGRRQSDGTWKFVIDNPPAPKILSSRSYHLLGSLQFGAQVGNRDCGQADYVHASSRSKVNR